MEKKTAWALLICFLLIISYTEVYIKPKYYQGIYQKALNLSKNQQKPCTPAASSPPSGYVKKEEISQERVVTKENTETVKRVKSENLNEEEKVPPKEEVLRSGIIGVKTPIYQAKISLLGGRLVSFKLLNYKASLKEQRPLELISSLPSRPYPLGLYYGTADKSDASVLYSLKEVEGRAEKIAENDPVYLVHPNSPLKIVLEGNIDGIAVKKVIIFPADSYLLTVSVEQADSLAQPVWLGFRSSSFGDLKASYNDPLELVYFNSDNSLERQLFSKLPDGIKVPQKKRLGDVRWLAVGDKYFTHALVSAAKVSEAVFEISSDAVTAKNKQSVVYHYNFLPKVRVKDKKSEFKLLLGPKKYEELAAYNYELTRTINLGIFTFIAHPILVLMKFIYLVFGNWGVAIIILTLLIKLVFYPLTKASYESMEKMKKLQPEIQALKERIEEQNTLHQEILKLYREKGVNPLGGCLPSLIQLPVFFGLFSALRNAIELRHAPYALWIKDLSAPQRLYVGSFGIPVLALLMGAAMLAQQKIMPSSADPKQKKIGFFMTIFFVVMFILYPFPSGLALYMVVNFAMSLLQQYMTKTEKNISTLKALLMASAAIFLLGYLLTLI